MRVLLTTAVIILMLFILRRWPYKGVRIGLLLAYVAAVLIITLWTRNYDTETHVVVNPLGGYQVMLRSFSQATNGTDLWRRISLYKGQMTSIALNVLLFIPLGFLVPSCFSVKIRWTWWGALLLGLCGSLLIETTQLITHLGWFDTSDLLHNTLGTLIGYGLYRKVLLKKEP